MSVAAAIREMLAKGMTLDDALAVVEAFEADREDRSTGARRQARYRERKRNESVTKRNGDDRNESDALLRKSVTPVTPLARVEDNLLPLETAGGFQEEGEFQVSRETFNSLVPDPKSALRKQTVALCQTVVGMWNDMASGLRLVVVRDITAARQAAIVARSEDLVKTYDFPDALAGWRKLMGLVRGSPFLRGELNGFRCDFDFVTRASSFTKIMEGKYEARQTSGRRR
jgi:hypothetical protein